MVASQSLFLLLSFSSHNHLAKRSTTTLNFAPTRSTAQFWDEFISINTAKSRVEGTVDAQRSTRSVLPAANEKRPSGEGSKCE